MFLESSVWVLNSGSGLTIHCKDNTVLRRRLRQTFLTVARFLVSGRNALLPITMLFQRKKSGWHIGLNAGKKKYIKKKNKKNLDLWIRAWPARITQNGSTGDAATVQLVILFKHGQHFNVSTCSCNHWRITTKFHKEVAVLD